MLRSLLKFSPPMSLVKAECLSTQRILSLDNLQFIEGSRKKRIRVGRGTGSGRGKLCGYGHQKSRSTPPGFEGGQTPFYKTRPKIGFHNHNERDLQVVTLSKVQTFIDMGRLKPPTNGFVTIRDLLECGLISRAKDGVKLLANDYKLRSPVHFEVSFASEGAIKEVEAAGGTVTCVHFNRLALRSLIKPLKFDLLPRRARPSPKIIDYYLDKNKCGYLSPEIQQRNLAMFGAVTSEPAMREQFEKVMHQRRIYMKMERDIVEGLYDKQEEGQSEAATAAAAAEK